MEFEKLARDEALDPNQARSGGRMKPFLKIELLDIWRAIDEQKLKPGTYTKTPSLLTDNSFAVIKLEGVLAASTLPPADREKMERQITRYRVDQWLGQARQRAKIDYPTTISVAVKNYGA